MSNYTQLKSLYEAKLQLFKADALSKLEELETRLNWIEEVSGL